MENKDSDKKLRMKKVKDRKSIRLLKKFIYKKNYK